MAEMVKAGDLRSPREICVGSSPTLCIRFCIIVYKNKFIVMHQEITKYQL